MNERASFINLLGLVVRIRTSRNIFRVHLIHWAALLGLISILWASVSIFYLQENQREVDKKVDATMRKLMELMKIPLAVDALEAVKRSKAAGLVDVSPKSLTDGSLK